MERAKKTEAVHGEIHLHESIIQHIQSFLSSKEAAQTSILCKPWYNAWVTRPVVDLDIRHFRSRRRAGPGRRRRFVDGFLESSQRVIRRYEESNLKIKSFRFCMEDVKAYRFPPINELIVNAMKLGACDVDVAVLPRATKFDLPHEVLRSENLVRLSVSWCKINLEAMGGEMVFSKLKFLSLYRVCIVGIPTLDIASNCPLLEELELSQCNRSYTYQAHNGNKVKILTKLALGSLNEVEKQSLGLIVDAPIRVYDNLKSLYLHMIRIDKLLFNDMSRYFPCLKDLTLSSCKDSIGLEIYSPSLEFLSLEQMNGVCEKFDVPSLRKFTFSYEGTSLSCPSFVASLREWESEISLVYLKTYIKSNWLNLLKNFLMKLSLSKISLSLCFGFSSSVENLYLAEPSPCLPKPVVENLKLSMCDRTSVCSSLLKGVFWTCRPKYVTQDLQPQLFFRREDNCDMVKLLCKTLIDKESESCCIPSRHMSDLYGLENVDVEVFADSVAEWQPLPWKALVNASKSPEKKQIYRFKLGWRQNPAAHPDEIL